MNYYLLGQLSMLVIAESVLVYTNLVARLFNPQYFVEGNGFWRRYFDQKGPFWVIVSLFIHIIIVFSLFVFFYIDQFSVGLLVGFVVLNALTDWMTIKQHYKCLNSNCSKLPHRIECVRCRRVQ